MKKVNPLVRLAKNPFWLFSPLAAQGLFNWMPDELYIKCMYRAQMGRKLNLKSPKTFNEKLQWLKLYDRKPLYTQLVDKYEVRKYIEKEIGNEYLVPLVGGPWDSPEDIDFESLPDQFVLKCTHDSGGLIICRNKTQLNIKEAKKKLKRCLNRNFYYISREWPYKDVKPRIIAEMYMEDSCSHNLKDYKLFAFDGVAKALFIATDRQVEGEDTKFDFFDLNFKHLDIINGHPNADSIPARPSLLAEMQSIAEKLSKGFPELRVDFYEVNGKAYFGELTFFHWSGLVPFEPEKWDETFGSWIELPVSCGGGYILIHNGYVMWLRQKTSAVGLVDYKFFCFDGESKLLYVSEGLENHSTASISFYNMDGKELPFHRSDYQPLRHNLRLPSNYKQMVRVANDLAKGIDCPFVRIDLYSINTKIYFSEITFYPCGGMIPIEPSGYDIKLGTEICLH